MTRRILFFLPLAALTLVASLLAFRAGYWQANLTETDVINTYAAKYVAETGGDPTDCVATPGQTPVWIEVICRSGDGTARIYPVNKLGALLPVTTDQEAT